MLSDYGLQDFGSFPDDEVKVRLFRLTSIVVPEYGAGYDEEVYYYQTDDREKLVIYLKGLFDIDLDVNGYALKYYSSDRVKEIWQLDSFCEGEFGNWK